MLDYSDWIYYWSLCVTMAQIATGPIAERTSLDTYFFFSFLTSALVFPIGIAITWQDGWLANLGFKDFAGAGLVHLTGGMTGFIGTWLTGPRLGLFSKDMKYKYFIDDNNFSSESDEQSEKESFSDSEQEKD